MNYYEHHLGDWAAATGHLSWDEDMAYTRLLRAYYHAERAIPQGQQYRLAKASTPAQRKAVDAVLDEFFDLRDGAYHQKRADEEIARYRAKSEKAKASINARWSRIKSEQGTNNGGNTTVSKTGYERTTDDIHRAPVPRHQTPDTNLHEREEVVGNPPTPPAAEPEPKAARKRAAAPDKPLDVAQQVWDDWLALRARKRAPVTQTVLDGARSEAHKAGMPLADFLAVWCMRGSQGLQADWLQADERRPAAGGTETFRERDDRLARERYLELVGRSPKPAATVVDVVDVVDAPARRQLA